MWKMMLRRNSPLRAQGGPVLTPRLAPAAFPSDAKTFRPRRRAALETDIRARRSEPCRRYDRNAGQNGPWSLTFDRVRDERKHCMHVISEWSTQAKNTMHSP